MTGNKLSKEDKNKWLSDVFDDLTYLEINTIVKDSISAEIAPEFEDLVTKLLDRYKLRLHKIILEHNLSPDLSHAEPKSFEQLDANLDATLSHMAQESDLRIDDHDYSILLRINRFLNYLKKSLTEVKPKVTGLTKQNLYQMDFEVNDTTKFDFRNINPRIKARFRRMYDMNAEKVVMQTRFGIDGDVTSRIAAEFTQMDHQMLLKIHEQHTNLSLTYWKEMVSTVTTILGQIFKYFKPG